MRTALVETGKGKFGQVVRIGTHALVADEPTEDGGGDAGPAPHEWILAALGACTSMTLKAYADRKGWPLKSVEVRLDGEHRDGAFVITRHIETNGDLTAEQRARLGEIADKCPVHRTLSGTILIEPAGTPSAR